MLYFLVPRVGEYNKKNVKKVKKMIKDEKNRRGYYKNKINSVIKKNSGLKISVFYYIIYQYF